MIQRLLATLLHYANSSPPCNQTEFYALKERLLNRYGKLTDYQVQEIRKDCWGEWNRYGDRDGCTGAKCRRCGGTGVFSVRWFYLEKREWCGFTFHRPSRELYKEVGAVEIVGRIEHKDYGRVAKEAALWLYLLTGEWRLLWQAMQASRCCGRFLWPLLNVQRIVFEIAINSRTCWRCRKRIWSRQHAACKACRKVMASEPEEIPF